MLKDYVRASTKQLIRRTSLLRSLAMRGSAREASDLRRICSDKLNNHQSLLEAFLEDLDAGWDKDPAVIVAVFRRLSQELDFIERDGVAVLQHLSPDDIFLNRLLAKMCEEVSYPLLVPTVIQTSRNYFFVSRSYNLIHVPLLESSFLLHLPDLYHELGHLLFIERNKGLPGFKIFRASFARCLLSQLGRIDDALTRAGRMKQPARSRKRYERWRKCWSQWLEEFFCDLFAVYLAGPAYAWSHLHLSMKRGGPAFGTLEYESPIHPPDHARMTVLLGALEKQDFSKDANEIRPLWSAAISSHCQEISMTYRECFPDAALDEIVDIALQAFKELPCRPAQPGEEGLITSGLNQAWRVFWEVPERFPDWEERAVGQWRTIFGDGS